MSKTTPKQNERVLYEGAADPPRPPEEDEDAQQPVPVIIRLHRVKAVANALGDALQRDGDEYSEHLTERALVCDLLSDEVAAITVQLIEEDKGEHEGG